jgi:nucleotide-binding universal stress UspA family protein
VYKNILIPTDGSELSLKAVKQGIALARQIGAKVTAMIVRAPLREFVAEGVAFPVPDNYRKAYIQEIDHHLDAARREAVAAGVTCDALQVESEEPWRAITATAKAQGADLIVMASHGRRGVSALVLGSETQKVLTHSTIPVLVYR